MASRKKLAAITEAHGQQAHVPAEEPQDDNLDDGAVQEKIMNPKPGELKLSFQDLHLFPFSMEMLRAVSALVAEVQAEIFGSTVVNDERLRNIVVSNKIAATVNNPRKTYADDIFRYVAAATAAPGKMDERQADAIAAEFSQKANASDVVVMFTELMLRVIPKNGATQAR